MLFSTGTSEFSDLSFSVIKIRFTRLVHQIPIYHLNKTIYCLAREGGRALQVLTPEERSDIIFNLANSLIENQSDILAANKKDLEEACNAGNS